MMVHAVLTAVLEWANYQPVISASVDCLRIMLHYLNSGTACSFFDSGESNKKEEGLVFILFCLM